MLKRPGTRDSLAVPVEQTTAQDGDRGNRRVAQAESIPLKLFGLAAHPVHCSANKLGVVSQFRSGQGGRGPEIGQYGAQRQFHRLAGDGGELRAARQVAV